MALSIHSHFTQEIKDVWSLLNTEPLTQFQWLKRKDAITALFLVIHYNALHYTVRRAGLGRHTLTSRYESSSEVRSAVCCYIL